MPRIRTIKPEALQHRKVGRLSDRAFRLWIGLITQADDLGRLRWDLEQYRVIVWGYHEEIGPGVVQEALDELLESGLVVEYGDQEPLLALPSWGDHQKVDHPRPSVLPPAGTPYKKASIPPHVRRAVAWKYGAMPGVPKGVRCHWCQEAEGLIHWWTVGGWVAFQSLELDHLEPERMGGETSADNIVLSCRRCNRSRGALAKPREPSRSLANVRGGSEGSEGSEGRKDRTLANAREGQPASALQGAPAGPAQDSSEQNHPGPLADPIAEFMATVRRAAAGPTPGLLPRRGDDCEV